MPVRSSATRPRMRGLWPRVPVVALLVLGILGGSGPTAAQTLLDRPARLVTGPVQLAEALRLLQERSAVGLVFSPDLLPDVKVSCSCRTETVRQALETLLRGTGLTFTETRSQVLIVPRTGGRLLSGVVAGRVTDDATGEPVPSVAVRLDSGQGVLTDESGRFLLRGVPAGSRRVEVTGIGWEPWSSDPVEVASDTVTLAVGLRRGVVALPEIIVEPGTFGVLESVPPGTVTTITRQEIEAMPQLGEDVFRSLTRLAGVSAHDISTRLSIRGSRDADVMVRLDGLELYEPYHLQDFDGAFGIVDLATLAGVELKAGGFGVDYGGKSGGVLDMRSRTALGPRRSTANMNISHLSAMSEGGFKQDRGSWLVSVREGFLGLMLKLVGADRRLSPRFYDVFAKVAYEPAPGHKVVAHLLHAGDRFRLDVGAWDGLSLGEGIEAGNIRSDWSSTYGWVTWEAPVGRIASARTSLQSGHLSRLRVGGLEDVASIGTPEQIDVSDDRGLDFVGVQESVDVELSPDLLLRFGGEVRKTWAEYDYFARTATPFLAVDGVARLRVDTSRVALRPEGERVAGWVATRGRVGGLTGELGLRYERTTKPTESHLSPRLQFSFAVSDATTLKASAGRYYRYQRIGDLQVGDGQTVYPPAERSDLVALGLERRLSGTARLRVEAYDRRIANQQPLFVGLRQELQVFPEQQGDRIRLDPGRGRVRGVELFVEGSMRRDWRWSASYALSKAEDEIPQTTPPCADGPTCLSDPWVPRSRDQRHAVNLQVDYRPGERWNLAAAWTFHSGWPATEWRYGAELRGDGTPFFTRTFGPLRATRLPAYHRLDVRATRTFRFGGRSLDAYADLFNVYNHRNRGSYDYAVRYLGGDQVETVRTGDGEKLLPFLPMVGLRFRF